MSILSAFTRHPAESRSLNSSILQAWGRGDLAPADSLSGVAVNRDTVLGLSAVWACVSLISDSIATLPRAVRREDSDGVRTKAKTPDWMAIRPNPEQTWIDFVFSIVASMLLDGNAFIYTVRDGKGNVVRAWCLDPSYVHVQREEFNGQLRLVYYVTVSKGLNSPVGPFRVPAGLDMFHIPAFVVGVNAPRGLSPIEVERQMFGGAIASQEMGARFFGSGMNAGGVIETDEPMDIEQARELKRDFAQANGGLRKMHLPPVLTGGASFKQVTISPEQAQFLQHREFTVEDVARLFRVPPYMIGAMTKTTTWGSGIEQQGIGFVTYTLRPWITRIEESFSLWMLMGDPDLKVTFDVDGLLRGDVETRAKWYAAARQWGWMSANDIRLSEGEEPIGPEGDLYLTPVNMAAPAKFPTDQPLPTGQGEPAPETQPAAVA